METKEKGGGRGNGDKTEKTYKAEKVIKNQAKRNKQTTATPAIPIQVYADVVSSDPRRRFISLLYVRTILYYYCANK